MTAEPMALSDTNAGLVVGWLNQRGIHAVMRGGPGGGSKGATVIVPDSAMVLEPGDRIVIDDGQVILR